MLLVQRAVPSIICEVDPAARPNGGCGRKPVAAHTCPPPLARLTPLPGQLADAEAASPMSFVHVVATVCREIDPATQPTGGCGHSAICMPPQSNKMWSHVLSSPVSPASIGRSL
eukprot:5754913-Alexandrium_andersonii.AAC.1